MLMLSATLELGFLTLLYRYCKDNFIKTGKENDGNAQRMSPGPGLGNTRTLHNSSRGKKREIQLMQIPRRDTVARCFTERPPPHNER